MKHYCALWGVVAITLFAACHREKELPLIADFSYEIEMEAQPEHHAAAATFVNASSGAYKYKWTFEGGNPAVSEKKQPGIVTWSQSGSYQITLEAWNSWDNVASKTITIHLDTALYVDFTVEARVDNSAPVEIILTNKSRGAFSFLWQFSGGIPAQSTERTPQKVCFTTPGVHNITLTAKFGEEERTLQKTITVTPPLTADFDLVLPFSDAELPLSATLKNKSTHYNTIEWSADNGAVVSQNHAETTAIRFTTAGLTHIFLKAMSLKDTITVTKTITVLPDKNLLTFSNLHLGITTANISPFFSTSLRTTIPATEAQQNQGAAIDIVYWGHSRLFTLNRFLSPDSVAATLLPPILNPMKTWVINNPVAAGIPFGDADFSTIATGQDLQQYAIYASGGQWQRFDLNILPYFVLYETEDGRKGVIKVKQTVDNGMNSYIIIDVKVQKHRM